MYLGEKTDLKKAKTAKLRPFSEKSLISETFCKIPKTRPNFEKDLKFLLERVRGEGCFTNEKLSYILSTNCLAISGNFEHLKFLLFSTKNLSSHFPKKA